MSRIDRKSIIRRIAQAADMASILEKHGIEVKRQQTGPHSALCPFHDDSRPSFYLYPASRDGYPRFHCFGCGQSGNVFDLVQQLKGFDFRESLRWLSEYERIPLPAETENVSRLVKADLRKAGLLLAFDTFRLQSPEEQELLDDWLSRRNISASIARDAGIMAIKPNKLTRSIDLSDFEALAELEAAGVVTRRTRNQMDSKSGVLPLDDIPRDHYRSSRILFPLLTSTGQLTGFAGRAINEDDAPKYLYSRGFSRSSTLYHADAILRNLQTPSKRHGSKDKQQEPLHLYIVEGLIDALRMDELGFSAVSLLGNQCTKGQRDELRVIVEAAEQQGRLVICHLFLDRDSAGQDGTFRALPQLLELAQELGSLRVDVIVPPVTSDSGKDPDELLSSLPVKNHLGVIDLVKSWCCSPMRFLLAHVIGCPSESLDSIWESMLAPEHARAFRMVERLMPPSTWSSILSRTAPFSDWLDNRIDDTTPWGSILHSYLAGTPSALLPTITPPTHYEITQRDANMLALAYRLAHASTQRREFPVDEASWERLAGAADLFKHEFVDRLALGDWHHHEPMIATLVRRKPGDDPRLKALPAPEDLILQQYVLNELLRDTAAEDEILASCEARFTEMIPAVRYQRGDQHGLWVTGPEYFRPVQEAVSFAYQVDMDVVNGMLPPRREGMFRSYQECWVEFISHIDRRIAGCQDELLYATRLDIHRYYDCLPRYTINNVLLPSIQQAFQCLPDAYTKIRAPLFQIDCEIANERSQALVDWMCDQSFHYEYYDPSNGRPTRYITPHYGIPQGPDLSAYLANIALFPFDRLMSEEIARLDETARINTVSWASGGVYARYVDDIVLVATSAGELRRLTTIVEDELRKLGLELSKKTDPLPPMRGRELRAWLMDQRGLGLQPSGPFAAPPSEIPLARMSPLADMGEVDRKDALSLLHDPRLDDPIIPIDEVCDSIRVALKAQHLRHGDFVVAAKRLWQCVARSAVTETSPLDAARAMHKFWQRVEGPMEAEPDIEEGLSNCLEVALPTIVWLEGLERYLHARIDRSPLFLERDRLKLEGFRKVIAGLVTRGLCQEICGFEPTLAKIIRNHFQHMIEMRIASTLWAALQALPETDVDLIKRDGLSEHWPPIYREGALPRYHLGIAESLAVTYSCEGTLEQTWLQSTLVDEKDKRGIWRLHEAIIRLAAYQGSTDFSTDPLYPMISRIPDYSDTRPPSLRILALWNPDTAKQQNSLSTVDIVCRDAFQWLCRQSHGLTNLMSYRQLLCSAICQITNNNTGILLPIPPGISVPAILMFCYSTDTSHLSPENVRALFLKDEDSRAALQPWQSSYEYIVNRFAPQALNWQVIEQDVKYELLIANWDNHYSQMIDALAKNQIATTELLRWLAKTFRALVGQQQMQEEGYEIIPTAYSLCSSGENDSSSTELPVPSLLGFVIRQSALSGQAFIRYGANSLRVIPIPETHAYLWRIGVVLADILGRQLSNSGFEGLRLSTPAASPHSSDWILEGMIRFSLAILQGASFAARERVTQRDRRYLPACVDRVLKNLSSMAELPADDPRRLSLLLSTIADGRALSTRLNTRCDSTLIGGSATLLAEIANHQFNVDEDLADRLDNPMPGRIMPKRRTALSWANLAERIAEIAKHSSTDTPALPSLVSGLRITAVEAYLRGLVLDLWATLSTEARHNLQNITVIDDELQLGTPLLLHLNVKSQRYDLNKRFEKTEADNTDGAEIGFICSSLVSVTEDDKLSAWSSLSQFTPLGWIVLLGILTGIVESNFRTPIMRADVVGIDSIKLSYHKLVQSLATPSDPKSWGDPWTEFSTITNIWYPIDISSIWAFFQKLEEVLELEVKSIISAYFELISPVGKPCMVRASDGAQHAFSAWRIRAEHLHNERRAHYENIYNPQSECVEYLWSETRHRGRLLGIDINLDGLASIAGLAKANASISTDSTQPPDDSRIDRVPQEAVPSVDSIPSSDDSGVMTDEKTAFTLSNSSPRCHAEACVSEKMEQPKLTDERSEEYKKLLVEFRSCQQDAWLSRGRPKNDTHIRVALVQWQVEESYRHPIYEACHGFPEVDKLIKSSLQAGNAYGTHWEKDEFLPSCAEYRRRQMLLQILQACQSFEVDILVLPEYSMRPETVEWLAIQLTQIALKITVWAGTYRLPPNHSGITSPSGVKTIHEPWRSVLPVIFRPDSDRPEIVDIAYRFKKYPAVAVGEEFYPSTRHWEPVMISKHSGFIPSDYIAELICSEIFLTSSPANMPALVEALYTRLAQHNANESTLKVEEYVKEDIWNFACYTSIGRSRKFHPRRTVILVPAMTTRAQDYAIFGQASFLAASLTTVFCNAAGPHGAGRSCIIGTGSWDNGDSEAPGFESGVPYRGVFPGIFRQSEKDRGWLGKCEQAMVIADIDPEYAAEGKPRQQVLLPPLRLVAHLPIIESTGPLGMPTNKDELLCCCRRFASRVKKRIAQNSCVEPCAGRSGNGMVPEKLLQDFVAIIQQTRSSSVLGKDVAELIYELAKWADDGKWLERRADAYRQHGQALSAPNPPPTIVDWLYIDLPEIEQRIIQVLAGSEVLGLSTETIQDYPEIHVPSYREP